MNQMNDFEVKQPEVDLKLAGRNPNTTCIGKRVGKYKNELIKLQRQASPNLQIEKSDQETKLNSEVQVTGTAPGTRSVVSAA
jgi:hypothetical protein